MRFTNNFVPARFLVMAFTALLWGSIAAPQARITSLVKPEQRITVAGTTSPLLKRSMDHGRLPGGQNLGRMVLLLAPSAQQEQDAEQFVASLHDPSSPNFHKWLAPAEYGQRFDVADEDAAQVQQWLQNQGLTVHEVSQSRRFVVFSGTVSQVESTFSTEMHAYDYKGLKFIANAAEIQIPAALQPVVKGVVRLHSEPRQNNARMGNKFTVNRKNGNIEGPFGLHFLGPADFATIYNVQPLYDAGINGAGQTIAIVSRSSLVDANYGIDGVQDIRDFRNVMGLPPNDPEVIINGDDPGVISYGDTQEAMLDVTWAGAVAPMAHIKVVASQSNFGDGVDASAAYIVDHNLAPIMSTSFGVCEQNMGPLETAFFNSLWQQAAAQGITVFVSAGDNGGAGCDDQGSGQYAYSGLAVNGIASTPYNVAVGGTQFDDTDNPDAYWSVASDPTILKSVLSYIPEKVWNESDNDPFFTSLWAGSGGVSTLYAKPAWQSAAGVPNDGKRDLPDFSIAAAIHTGYAVCFLGYCSDPDYVSFYTFGGTSASSPAAAGIMALVLQKMGGQTQGMANYVFYRLASVPGVYHDITKGDNKVPDSNGQYTVGYAAGTSYDLASGLGSFDANALVNNWQAAAAALGSSTTLSLASGQASNVVHGTPVTFHARVTCSGAGCAAPTGPVSLIATSSTGDITGVGAVPLVPGASRSTANITTAEIPGGTYGVVANHGGDGNYYASSSGQISLLVDGAAPNTVTRNFVTPTSLILNYGENSTVFGNGKTLTGQSSVMPNLSSGFAAGTHQVQASYPGDNSFNGSTANYSFTVTKEDSLIRHGDDHGLHQR